MAGINGFNPRSMTPKVNLGEVGKTDKNNAVGEAQNMQAGETLIDKDVDVQRIIGIHTQNEDGSFSHYYIDDGDKNHWTDFINYKNGDIVVQETTYNPDGTEDTQIDTYNHNRNS